MSRGSRLGRWILPASGLSMAIGALLFLVALEFAEEPLHGVPTATQAIASIPAHPASASAPDPRSPISDGPRARFYPLARHPGEAIPQERALPATRKTRVNPKLPKDVRRLVRAATLAERLKVIETIATRPDEKAATALANLLDGPLPGTQYESSSLRVSILAQLGKLKSQRAEQALLAHLDPNKPRPLRMIALGMIAARPELRPAELEAIARSDHDAVVHSKAKRVLGYQ